jgi:GNAT superfamily N-acetyltransferase
MADTDQQGYTLLLTDAPSAEEDAIIDGGLADYNREKAGYVDARPLAVLIRDPGTSAVVGGLLGRTTLGLFFIDLVYLPPGLRYHGVGSAMLAAAEQEARRRGCTAVTLFTIWFQAPDFYARHGYREVGRIECAPPGHTRICMAKQLADAAGISAQAAGT